MHPKQFGHGRAKRNRNRDGYYLSGLSGTINTILTNGWHKLPKPNPSFFSLTDLAEKNMTIGESDHWRMIIVVKNILFYDLICIIE